MNVSAPSLDQALVLEKCKNYLDFQLWPIEMEAQIEPWLSNFLPEETEHAYHLLNSFLFFSERMIKQLFLSAVNDLSSRIRKPGRTMNGESSAWRSLFDGILVTQVTGETPSPTDSGYLFARYARDYLGFDEAQILPNEEVLRVLVSGNPRPVVFVDDFAGSGNQFLRMWKRQHRIGMLDQMSFARYAANQRGGFFAYCPALCTQYGADKISGECPEVLISPGNLLTPQYSAVVSDSIIWPEHLRRGAFDFLRTASARAGIPENDSTDDWRGFHKLGLCIAFAHGIPDASLPLFKWQKNGWSPLMRYA
jgi:hypothetical protein